MQLIQCRYGSVCRLCGHSYGNSCSCSCSGGDAIVIAIMSDGDGETGMVQRKQYMEKLIKAKDEKIIKAITGIRRCGKSTLLAMFQQRLLESGVGGSQIVSINFEDIKFEGLLEYHSLHEYVSERLVPGKTTYVFLDEIQHVPQFQRAVDSLFIKDGVDIYLTGSNAHMLSGDLATLLTGRYVEINMLPLSFAEYFEIKGGNKRDAFLSYCQNGGFPQTAFIADDGVRNDYVRGLYSTVLLKDIATRKKIADVVLLESVARFLFDNIGNIVSSNKIANTLTSHGRKTTPVTVENYVGALEGAFMLYKAPRYDVKGKQLLKSLEKYYASDISLRHVLLGENVGDMGRVLENVVYLELLRRGYAVAIGKIGQKEIDFIAEKSGGKIYFQVCYMLYDESVQAREFGAFGEIADNYPKYVLSLDDFNFSRNGYVHQNVIDFLLSP